MGASDPADVHTRGRPPRDPRDDRHVPPLGALPRVAAVTELAWRVIAPNPSPMTLDGTNTYVVGSGDAAVVVDPGPDDEEHLGRVVDVLEQRRMRVQSVFVTHRHLDHAAAAARWAAHFGATLVACARDVAGSDGRLVGDGDVLELPGALTIDVVATPGHTSDHLALALPDGTILTGDHVLGRGTSVVTHPDGDLDAYLSSLRLLRSRSPAGLLPGHGPAMLEGVDDVLEYYLAHRRHREAQIVAALGASPMTVDALVAHVYAGLDERVLRAATASTRTTLDSLVARGVVVEAAEQDGVWRIAPGVARD